MLSPTHSTIVPNFGRGLVITDAGSPWLRIDVLSSTIAAARSGVQLAEIGLRPSLGLRLVLAGADLGEPLAPSSIRKSRTNGWTPHRSRPRRMEGFCPIS